MTRRTPLALLAALALSACGGGTSGPGFPTVDPLTSTVTVGPAFGTLADGSSEVALEVRVVDAAGLPIAGARVRIEASGSGNTLQHDSATGADGRASGVLRSLVAEPKTLTFWVDAGGGEVLLGTRTSEFVRFLEDTYFVRSTGSDSAAGTTPLEAWRSLDHALAQVGPGDTLILGAGTYTGGLSLATVAPDDRPFTLLGDTTGRFTGDAGQVRIEAFGLAFGLELKGCANVVLRGLAIHGAAPGEGVVLRGANNRRVTVVDCELYENATGISIEGGQEILVESNRISNNTGDAVRIGGTTASAVQHNLVYNNAGSGIVLTTASTDLVVEANTIYRNAGDQLREEQGGGTGRVANNVFVEGGTGGAKLIGGSSFERTHNLSFGNPGDPPGTGDLIADPAFVDPFGPDGVLGGPGATDDDFRVLPSSPVLDAGATPAIDATLPFADALAARTSLADDTPDGTGTDGAALNLGYHYPVPLDPYGSLAPGGARVVFARPGDPFLRTRRMDPTSGLWSSEARSLAANRDPVWTVLASRPGLQPDEAVACLVNTGTRTELRVRIWDGRTLETPLPAVFPTYTLPSDTDERDFDLAFESNSGDLLLVRAGPDANPLYRTFRNGRWSGDAPVFPLGMAAGNTLWIELEPNPNDDSIALVALDDQNRLVTAVWDGAAWQAPLLLDTEIVEARDFRAFDAAWESLSGELLVAWGYSVFAEETRYATWSPATGQWTTGLFASTDAVAAVVRMDADPTSDRIVAIFGEGSSDDDVTASVWDGERWTNTVEFTLTGQPRAQGLVAAWAGTTGEAIALFREASLQSEDFDFAIFRNGGWHRQPAVDLPGVRRIVRADATRVPGTDALAVLFLDESGNLFELEYDQGTWAVGNGGAPLAGGLDASRSGQAFALSFR